MPVTITTTLHPSQKAVLQSMDAAFPVDDADFFALYEIDELVCSAAAFIQEDESCYECYGFTAPAFRQQGFFTTLLDLALDELPEFVDIMFYTTGKDPACMATIEALEAELMSEEHMMELDLSRCGRNFTDMNDDSSKSDMLCAQPVAPYLHEPFHLRAELFDIDGTKTLHYENPIGTVNISVFSSYYYLYGFEIQEELRGKGLGKQFLYTVLNDLISRNPMPLRLQVSGDNLPALSLYKKTGFQITETLFGYLY